ncbi:glutamate-5-semialdehyde dehydrogenase [Candidatus Providencia siddallii]|uniref:Gamma-glutamyl phosphate reductase n=1 Tax=Candidatus Providencia siddallii TaxID=1715285 RepID=A0ABM9NPU2_9GAMM
MLNNFGKTAKIISKQLSKLNTKQKNQALNEIAISLKQKKSIILESNNKDIKLAKKNNLHKTLQDRLSLTEKKLEYTINNITKICELEDPIGKIIDGKHLNNGLRLLRYKIPIGVICAIYESRPNVTIDITSLCLKTGNAIILRGGKEAHYSNTTIINIIQETLKNIGLPQNSVQLIDCYNHNLIIQLLKLNKYIDLLIPRGGEALHKLCREESTIPIISGGIGVCHIFVDEFVNFNDAINVIINSKVQNPSACNSLETLLIHKNIALNFLPLLAKKMINEQVTLHISKRSFFYLKEKFDNIVELKLENLTKEWLSLDLNVEIVDDINEAINHINYYGTSHSDAILTESIQQANYFVKNINSATVYVNASTRLTDGEQFGFGSEIAVSTQKLHTRGPSGLDSLTTYKWVGYGDFTIRK